MPRQGQQWRFLFGNNRRRRTGWRRRIEVRTGERYRYQQSKVVKAAAIAPGVGA